MCSNGGEIHESMAPWFDRFDLMEMLAIIRKTTRALIAVIVPHNQRVGRKF